MIPDLSYGAWPNKVNLSLADGSIPSSLHCTEGETRPIAIAKAHVNGGNPVWKVIAPWTEIQNIHQIIPKVLRVKYFS